MRYPNRGGPKLAALLLALLATPAAAESLIPLVQGSGTDFVPSDLSGLTIWLDMDEGILLFGSNIDEWQDQSAASNDVAQATDGNRPEDAAAGPTGDGVDEWLEGLALSSYVSDLGYAVGAVINVVSSSGAGIHYYDGDGVLGDKGGFWGICSQSSGLLWVGHFSGSADEVSLSYSTGVDYVLTWTFNSGTLKARLNEGAWSSTGAGAISNRTGLLAVFRSFNGYGNLVIKDLVIYNQAHSDADMNVLRDYLNGLRSVY